MTDGLLTSIEFTAKNTAQEIYNGIYAPADTPSARLTPITPEKQTDGTYTFTMPDYAVTVTVEFEEKHTHSTGDDTITFEAWTSGNSLPAEAGKSYYLNTDVTLDETWTVPSGTTNLCLNGHVVKLAADKTGSVIKVNNDTTLNLYDCPGTATHKFVVGADVLWTLTEDAIGGTAVDELNGIPKAGAVIIVSGGCITGGNAYYDGGGVYITEGNFNLYGGNIVGNSAGEGYIGGGVCLSDFYGNGGKTAVFNMSGTAQILGNAGGGVAVSRGVSGGKPDNNYSFNMDGGTIGYNVADSGGGVYLSKAAFAMTDGSIIGNDAVGEGAAGGGVGVFAGSTFTMSGGEAELTISYPTSKPVRVWYVAEDGTLEAVPSTFDGKAASFVVTHFSHYIIEQLDGSISSACPKNAICPIAMFIDAKPTEWYHDGVHFCVENGYMQGVSANKFAPSGTLSRAMIVTMLWRLEGKPVVNYAMSFKDVKADQWYTDAIRWAQSTGVVEGYNADSFGPDDDVTREQLATILYCYAQSKGEGFTGDWMFLLDFVDRTDISSWADEAVHWCSMKGIVGGKVFDPQGYATRAEAATMLQRFCENILSK